MLPRTSIPRRLGAGLFLVVLLPGCARHTVNLTLAQPAAPPSQQQMDLSSSWAVISDARSPRVCLIDCPLPGAPSGPRDFRLYLELPASGGLHAAGRDREVGGFLIQEVGARAGKAGVVDGHVKIERPLLARGTQKLTIDVTCDDETRITGIATVKADDGELRRFVTRYALDIAALRSKPGIGPPAPDAGDTQLAADASPASQPAAESAPSPSRSPASAIP